LLTGEDSRDLLDYGTPKNVISTPLYPNTEIPKQYNFYFLVGFEVFTAVVMKSTTFWDITPCSPVSTDVSEDHIASIFRVEKISSARNR
jgi:hypothetical protein